MKTIGTKVSDELREEAMKMAASQGMTVSEVLRVCIEELVYGRYEIDGEHLVPSEEYKEVVVNSEVNRYENEVNRLIEALEKKGYNVSRKLEEMAQMVTANGKDWGA